MLAASTQALITLGSPSSPELPGQPEQSLSSIISFLLSFDDYPWGAIQVPKDPKPDPYINRLTLCQGSLRTAMGYGEEVATVVINLLPIAVHNFPSSTQLPSYFYLLFQTPHMPHFLFLGFYSDLSILLLSLGSLQCPTPSLQKSSLGKPVRMAPRTTNRF
jgi:hypothetical protein